MHGYMMPPKIWLDGRRGHANLGPIQLNWGYTPGLRIYLTWPFAETRTLSTHWWRLRLRPQATVLWGGRPGIDEQAVPSPTITLEAATLMATAAVRKFASRLRATRTLPRY